MSQGSQKRQRTQKFAILSDPQRLMSLKLEFAATIDVVEHFVKATYFLEGDGPLVFAFYVKLLVSPTSVQLQLQLRRKTHVKT